MKIAALISLFDDQYGHNIFLRTMYLHPNLYMLDNCVTQSLSLTYCICTLHCLYCVTLYIVEPLLKSTPRPLYTERTSSVVPTGPWQYNFTS